MAALLIHCPIGDDEETQTRRPGSLSELVVFELSGSTCHVGRRAENDLTIDHRLVSRSHLVISKENTVWSISDLDSTNGTILNGKLLHAQQEISDGDVIELPGAHVLMFQDSDINRSKFKDQYRELYADEFPLDLSGDSLVRLSYDWGPRNLEGVLYVSPAVVDSKSYYFIQRDIDEFFRDARPGYTTTGWWGHGINSYAFYYQAVSAGSKVFFRLPYGGAYMDNSAEARRIAQFMQSYSDFRTTISSYDCRIRLVSSMNGTLDFRVGLTLSSSVRDFRVSGVLPYEADSFTKLEGVIKELLSSKISNILGRKMGTREGEPTERSVSTHMDGQRTRLAYSTDTGLVREHNEDSLGFINPEDLHSEGPIEVLAVVADGMGGHAAGEVASAMTVESVVDEIKNWVGAWHPLSTTADVDQFGPTQSVRDNLTDRLSEALQKANGQVVLEAERDQSKRGMGTTCTAAVLSNGKLHVAHVGDSRAYLFRSGELTQLTKDHSWVQEQVDEGNITVAEAWYHPRKNIITRAIGLDPSVDVDTYVPEVSTGDQILLCTDGLNTMLKDEEIREVMGSSEDAQQICDSLVQAANEAGGHDNITVMIMEIGGT